MHHRTAVLVLAVAAAACDGGSRDSHNSGAVGSPALSPEDYRKAQQLYADSLLNATQPAGAIVSKLGKDFQVGSLRLRDSVATLAGRTDCFANGRASDPYLAGTVSFAVAMGRGGSTAVRVQEDGTTWTSPAGNIVNACLNLAAKHWKFGTAFGTPASYITQVKFK